jgi:hypothetical protein
MKGYQETHDSRLFDFALYEITRLAGNRDMVAGFFSAEGCLDESGLVSALRNIAVMANQFREIGTNAGLTNIDDHNKYVDAVFEFERENYKNIMQHYTNGCKTDPVTDLEKTVQCEVREHIKTKAAEFCSLFTSLCSGVSTDSAAMTHPIFRIVASEREAFDRTTDEYPILKDAIGHGVDWDYNTISCHNTISCLELLNTLLRGFSDNELGFVLRLQDAKVGDSRILIGAAIKSVSAVTPDAEVSGTGVLPK